MVVLLEVCGDVLGLAVQQRVGDVTHPRLNFQVTKAFCGRDYGANAVQLQKLAINCSIEVAEEENTGRTLRGQHDVRGAVLLLEEVVLHEVITSSVARASVAADLAQQVLRALVARRYHLAENALLLLQLR